jgi:DNA gyrase subunit A
MATRKGRIKRVSLSEFSAVRPSGLIAMGLEDGDQLGWVRLTKGNDDIILVTEDGQALRMEENEIRPMGRQAGGVIGIHLRGGDHVTSMEVVEPGGYLMVITTLGYGKRSPLDEYPVKGRATGGVTTIDQKNMDRIGRIASARVVQEDDEITSISTGGTVLRQRVKDINPLGRATRGVRLMDMSKGDTVASLARLPASEVKSVEEESMPSPA